MDRFRESGSFSRGPGRNGEPSEGRVPRLPGSRFHVAARAKVGGGGTELPAACRYPADRQGDRKSTRLNSSHGYNSYAVFCLKKKNTSRREGVESRVGFR